MKDLFIGLGLLCCPAAIFAIFGISGMEAFDEGASRRVPAEAVELGRVAFAEECAACHGRLARGTERGPDLIHPDYALSVFGDTRFRRAVREGVTAGGGRAGMPAFRTVSELRLERMITFLREMQRANGIR